MYDFCPSWMPICVSPEILSRIYNVKCRIITYYDASITNFGPI